MTVTPTQIEEIRKDFAAMRSRQDLLDLLNRAKEMMYGEKAKLIGLKQLTWYANPNRNTKRYTEFTIRKKSGSGRTIHAPVSGLKSIQRALAFVLQCVFEPHKAATGFVRGKSIVDNARLHEGNRYVYNIDLKDFFHSIDQARVWKCLQLEPLNLNNDGRSPDKAIEVETGVRKFKTEFDEVIYYRISKGNALNYLEKKGDFEKYKVRLTSHLEQPSITHKGRRILPGNLAEYEKRASDLIFEDVKRYVLTEINTDNLFWSASTRLNLANIIASLCCSEMEVERLTENGEWMLLKQNVLPQGAPTSPVLTNVVCQRLDRRLNGLAKRFGLTYSRYADDITFSSMHNVYQEDGGFLVELHRIIKDQGFHINGAKTRLQKDGYRKEVTGLLVNEHVNIQKAYVKQIRMWLYYWERYGYGRAYSFFIQQYNNDKGHVKKGIPNMANVIAGKLEYLKMVKGDENNTYRLLKARFDRLSGSANFVDQLLDVWENEGIERAMDMFDSRRTTSIEEQF